MSLITAKTAQANARAKANRLVGMSNTAKPFYPEGENASDKTGMRPISTTAFKKGGKVVGKAAGGANAARADRVKRKAGGRIQNKFANIDQKEANKERIGGKDHIGGLKKGGVAKSVDGKVAVKKKAVAAPEVKKPVLSKAAPAKEPAKAIAKAPAPKAPKIVEAPIAAKAAAEAETMKPKASMKPVDVSTEETIAGTETPEEEEAEGVEMLKKGGRAKRKRGGRASKGSKINIIISAPQGGADPNQQMMQQPAAPSPRTPPPGAPPMMAGQPMGGPMMPPPGAGPQMPPGMAGGPPPMGMMPPGRKAGGRINASYASLKAGSGSGLGRLKKQGLS